MTEPRWLETLWDELPFLAAYARFPNLTGAIAPSSAALAEEIVSGIGVPDARTIVELGGGTGSFTREIVRRAPEEALILAIEINPRFASMLSSRFERVHVVNGSAERLRQHLRDLGRESADCIVSGLPWASFHDRLQKRLLRAIVDCLPDGGSFTTFAYLHAAWLPAARRFRDQLMANFARVSSTHVVWWNMPPAFVYRCVK